MDPMNAPDTANASAAPRTPGQLLRAAREAQGLHLARLSVTMKVPVRQLEALENDQYDAFRGPAFVRAVAQSMCRHLGLDPAPVLAGLPSTAATLQMHPAALGSPSKASSARRLGERRWAISPQVLGLAALMLAGSAALPWWPAPAPAPRPVAENVLPPMADASASDLPVSVNVPSVPQASAEAVAVSQPAALPASPSSAAPLPALAAKAAPTTSAPAASGAGPTALANGAGPAPSPAPSGASVPLSPATATGQARPSDMLIAASGDTWLEVRDARGQLIINRLLKAGETQPVELTPPYSVVIGRAHLAKVTRAGKDFDLSVHTKASTARFEVQP